MTVRLYHILPDGDPYGGSRNAAKAAIALRESGVVFETINMNRIQDLRPIDAPYRQNINPNGVTPTLDDNGFLIWESAAVLEYIADTRAKGRLIPDDAKKKARVHQWLAWEGATFQPGLVNVFLMVMAGDKGSEALTAARAHYEANLAIFNNALRGQQYVAGDFSIADIALGCAIPIGFHLNVDLSPYPEIVAWLRRLNQRPAFLAEPSFVADFGAGEKANLI